jgi:hypothetical protein
MQLKWQVNGTPISNPHLLQQRNKETQTVITEEVLPGDHWCTKQWQVHEDYGKTGYPIVSALETGRETLKEQFRVHFPDSTLIDDSNDGEEQQNLGICRCTTNRGDWNLGRNVINQSKIIWLIGTFKSFKPMGIDEIVPAVEPSHKRTSLGA